MSRFRYEFNLGKEVISFDVDFENAADLRAEGGHAEWTRLDFHQCKNCTLCAETDIYCPAAVDIEKVAERFENIISFDRVEVRVRTKQRDYLKECDVQTGLKSLVGLIMASGDCPILSQLKPLAYYHLPFADLEETITRVVGAYLLKQYFLRKDGTSHDFDLDGLDALYVDLQQVNTDFMDRIRSASKADANLNAISTLFALSAVISMAIQDRLKELKPLFDQGFRG